MLQNFDKLYNQLLLVVTESAARDFISNLCMELYKSPQTAYFGQLLLDMNIVVINDMSPVEVDYDDPDPKAYRDPTFVKVYCGGGYNEQQWCHSPTMAVDVVGNVYIGEQFVVKTIYGANDPKTAREMTKSVLIHESMHISELSFFRRQERDQELWNIATDAYINYYITKNNFKLPMGIIPDENGNITIKCGKPPTQKAFQFNILGKTAENIYEELELILRKKQPNTPTPDRQLQKGDPVFNKKTNQYGIIISLNPIKVIVVTKEEAMARSQIIKK
jgi:hypothetical protein